MRAARSVNETGIIPPPDGELLGGHALAVCAWDDAKGWLVFENSWMQDSTTPWAPKSLYRPGFGTLRYDYIQQFLDDNEADAWIPTDHIANKPPQPEPSKSSYRIQKKTGAAWRTVVQFS